MFAGLVAPFAGTLIEIRETKVKEWEKRGVAPFAGAWIEIQVPRPPMWKMLSLPSRERGLK